MNKKTKNPVLTQSMGHAADLVATIPALLVAIGVNMYIIVLPSARKLIGSSIRKYASPSNHAAKAMPMTTI